MSSALYYISLLVYWIFGIIYPIYQSYKAVEMQDSSSQSESATSALPGESTPVRPKTNGRLSHWVNFWIVSNLANLLFGILEHGNPDSMPAFYFVLKIGVLIYLSVAETDVSGMLLEGCITPFFKPLVPEIDSVLMDVSKEVKDRSSKLLSMAKSSASLKKNLPKKPVAPTVS